MAWELCGLQSLVHAEATLDNLKNSREDFLLEKKNILNILLKPHQKQSIQKKHSHHSYRPLCGIRVSGGAIFGLVLADGDEN